MDVLLALHKWHRLFSNTLIQCCYRVAGRMPVHCFILLCLCVVDCWLNDIHFYHLLCCNNLPMFTCDLTRGNSINSLMVMKLYTLMKLRTICTEGNAGILPGQFSVLSVMELRYVSRVWLILSIGFDRLAWGRTLSCHAKGPCCPCEILTEEIQHFHCIPSILVCWTSLAHLNWDDLKTAVPMAPVDFNAAMIDEPTHCISAVSGQYNWGQPF